MPIDFEVPYTLSSPQGDLVLHDTSEDERIYFFDPRKCSAVPAALRAETSGIPQGDGMILHDQFIDGFLISLAVELWEAEDVPACAGVANEMYDELVLHLNALLRPSLADLQGGNARLEWTPRADGTAGSARLYDRLRLAAWPTTELDEAGVVVASFALHTPYPYSITAAQIETVLSGTETLTNVGNAATFPVYKVFGPIDNAFQIWDSTHDLSIQYDALRPGAQTIGGGEYVEIDTFNGTMFLNGDEDNLMAGLDVEISEFFPLEHGPTELSLIGDGTCHVLWNYAWCS